MGGLLSRARGSLARPRTAFHNVRTAQVSEGGSTLTQQLARTLFLSTRRTLGRKSKEAVLALMLEEMLTKDQILELYLNRVYLSGGLYGVETMSRKLFVKRSRDLNLAECALIAGLIRGGVGRDNPPEWQVHTTFLTSVQQAAEQAVADGLRVLGVPGLQAALV